MARRGVLFGAQGPGYYDAREGSVAAVNAGSAMLQVRVPCCAAAANVDACSVARHTARPCRQQVLVKVCMYALCVCVCVCFDTCVLDCVYMCACLGVWWLCTHPLIACYRRAGTAYGEQRSSPVFRYVLRSRVVCCREPRPCFESPDVQVARASA
jgi:hypothetical protein